MKCLNRSRNRIGGFHMTSLKFKLLKILILQQFCFHDVWEQLKANIHTDFRSEWVLGFMIDDAWFQCVTWQLHDGHKSCHVALKSNLFRGIWLSEQSIDYKKYYFNVLSFSRNTGNVGKLSDRCPSCLPAAMLVPIWMGSSMASPYKSLWIWVKNSPHISLKKKFCDLNLCESFRVVTFFISSFPKF